MCDGIAGLSLVRGLFLSVVPTYRSSPYTWRVRTHPINTIYVYNINIYIYINTYIQYITWTEAVHTRARAHTHTHTQPLWIQTLYRPCRVLPTSYFAVTAAQSLCTVDAWPQFCLSLLHAVCSASPCPVLRTFSFSLLYTTSACCPHDTVITSWCAAFVTFNKMLSLRPAIKREVDMRPSVAVHKQWFRTPEITFHICNCLPHMQHQDTPCYDEKGPITHFPLLSTFHIF